MLMQRTGFFASSCSQIRTTFQPRFRNARLTNRSRAMFPASFCFQNARPVRLRFAAGDRDFMELFLNHFAGLE
jgi:hypothetical protein